MAELHYNTNSKQLSINESSAGDVSTKLVNLDQINKLTTAIIAESNPNFTPKPKDELSKMIKNMFESGMKNAKQNRLPEALKNVSLALEMAQRKRAPYEAFALQLQDMQFMLRQKIDLELVQGKYLDALQDIDMLLNTGLIQPEVFIRKTDALLKLKRYEEAKVECERGLCLQPANTKLKALNMECQRKLAEYNGEI